MKYTQSPVLVEAKQWIPDFNDKEIRDFAGRIGPTNTKKLSLRQGPIHV